MTEFSQARARWDETLERIRDKDPDWHEAGRDAMRKLPPDFVGTSEQIFQAITPTIGEPDKPSRCGALIQSALRAGIIKPTGTYVPSVTSKRPTAVYRRA